MGVPLELTSSEPAPVTVTVAPPSTPVPRAVRCMVRSWMSRPPPLRKPLPQPTPSELPRLPRKRMRLLMPTPLLLEALVPTPTPTLSPAPELDLEVARVLLRTPLPRLALPPTVESPERRPRRTLLPTPRCNYGKSITL